MPSVLSIYGADHILACLFGKTNTVLNSHWLALLRTPASKQASGSTLDEPIGGSYTRVEIPNSNISWGDPEGGVVATITEFEYPLATLDWGVVSGYALCDAQSAGNMILYGDFQMSSRIEIGDQARVNAQQLSLSVSTITGLTNSPFNL